MQAKRCLFRESVKRAEFGTSCAHIEIQEASGTGDELRAVWSTQAWPSSALPGSNGKPLLGAGGANWDRAVLL